MLKPNRSKSVTGKTLQLDRLNRRILSELQNDARVTNAELAQRVGLSPSACLKRVQALEATGCIRGYLMWANLDALTVNVQAYFLVWLDDTKLETTTRFEAFIQPLSNVIDCMRLGGEPDYIAYLACSDVPELTRLHDAFLAADIGVQRINMRVVMGQSKWFGGYPLDTLTWKTQV